MTEVSDSKAEFEILRGEAIRLLPSAAEDIPCKETSSPDCLCLHPVVSVVMTAYNHERYIRQAMEGVIGQETDFEYELIIGEDCSPDRTREICFEYQRRFPQKIRVLWSDANVNAIGGNSRRCKCRCRGEFVALCEGDDFWTDSRKLQKQVDVLRANPSAGVCFTAASTLQDETGKTGLWPCYPSTGLISGKDFVCDLIDRWQGPDGAAVTPITCTALYRRDLWQRLQDEHEIFRWRLSLGDTTMWLGFASASDVFVLADRTACYRIGSVSSAVRNNGVAVMRDGGLVRAYFSLHVLKRRPEDFGDLLRSSLYFYFIESVVRLSSVEQRNLGRRVFASPLARGLFVHSRFCLSMWFLRCGLINRFTKRKLYKWFPVFKE